MMEYLLEDDICLPMGKVLLCTQTEKVDQAPE